MEFDRQTNLIGKKLGGVCWFEQSKQTVRTGSKSNNDMISPNEVLKEVEEVD